MHDYKLMFPGRRRASALSHVRIWAWAAILVLSLTWIYDQVGKRDEAIARAERSEHHERMLRRAVESSVGLEACPRTAGRQLLVLSVTREGSRIVEAACMEVTVRPSSSRGTGGA